MSDKVTERSGGSQGATGAGGAQVEREGMKPAVFVIRMSAIGDALMTVRALDRLAQRGVEPVLVTSAANADVARCVPFLRWFAVVDGNSIVLHERGDADPHGRALADDAWPRFPVAHVLDLHRTARARKAGAILARALARRGIPLGRRGGVAKRTVWRVWLVFRAWLHSLIAHQAPRRQGGTHGLRRVHDLQREAVDTLLGQVGVPASNAAQGESPERTTGGSRLFTALPLVAHQGLPIRLPPARTYVVVVPGASGFVKQWPKEHFRRLALTLRARGVSHVVCVGGPQEAPLGRYVCHGSNDGFLVDATGVLTLAETFRVIEEARFLYTGDTFAAHVADLTGTPGVVFFGATSPRFGFVPVSDTLFVAYANLACSPCTRHGLSGCRFENLRCLRSLTPEFAASLFT